jgi:hypothetical protein
MTTERIHELCAEVMGWTPGTFRSKEPWLWNTGPGGDYIDIRKWRPTEDRNQSRMVVEKAREMLGTGDKLVSAFCDGLDAARLVWAWIEATPLQECEACLRALGLWEEQ